MFPSHPKCSPAELAALAGFFNSALYDFKADVMFCLPVLVCAPPECWGDDDFIFY